MAALQASQFIRAWCDSCGRRRGSDGRCPVCDPWWTSPFYVYGSLLTIGVTALLLTILPLLREPNMVTDNPSIAVLGTPTSFSGKGLPAAQLPVPPVTLYRRPLYVTPAPLIAQVVIPPVSANAGLADLARLRAMTDYAAGMETRRDAARAWSGIASQNVVPVPAVQFPRPTAAVPMPPTAAVPPLVTSSSVSPADSAGESAEGATSAATAPQRTL